MNYDEILKKVNPIYFSAKGCLGLLAETGDSDIVNFYNAIDKENLTTFEENFIIKSRVISLEARYFVWNTIAAETDCQTIIDLPCGYLPHCLTAAKLQKNYIGFDLPVVVEEIKKVAENFLNENEKIFVKYFGVDATNFYSMRNAFQNVQGKICIITDGLLGYFNKNDLKIVCENIHQLLQKFGGCWYVSDSQFDEMMGITYAAMTGDDKNIMLNATNSGNKKVSSADNSENLFLYGTLEERKNFIKDSSFSIKSFHYPEKLKIIPSLKKNPELMKKILSAYEDIEEWILTAEGTGAADKKISEIPFEQKFSLNDKILSISISGQLDTITSPKLLQKFEEQAKNFTEIKIDATEIKYISYAGLRVLKIMCDSLQDKNLFTVLNANDEVKKILSTEDF